MLNVYLKENPIRSTTRPLDSVSTKCWEHCQENLSITLTGWKCNFCQGKPLPEGPVPIIITKPIMQRPDKPKHRSILGFDSSKTQIITSEVRIELGKREKWFSETWPQLPLLKLITNDKIKNPNPLQQNEFVSRGVLLQTYVINNLRVEFYLRECL